MNAATCVDVDLLRRLPLPALEGKTDKNSRGKVLLVGGSRRVPGAMVLSGISALRVGAGKVQLAVPQSLSVGIGLMVLEAGIFPLPEDGEGEPMATHTAELRSVAKQADAVLVGPGIMNTQSAHELVIALLSEVVGPVYVIDALALCGLWDEAELLQAHAGRVVLTPNAGEMAQLCGVEKECVDADPVGFARNAAARLSSTIVLKGATTHIVTPSGLAYTHTGGVVGLATAGSGDVLAGILAGLASRDASPATAAIWAVFLHGRAGKQLTEDVGKVGFIAREVADEIPALLNETEVTLRG